MTEEYDVSNPNNVFGHLETEEPARVNGATFAGSCTVGAFTYFNGQSHLHDTTIGRFCSFGPDVITGPGNHPINFLTTHPIASDPSGISAGMAKSPFYMASTLTEVSRHNEAASGCVIGHDVWIGARVIILRGITIGTGAIIGAGAVVTKTVEPYSIVAGNPARLIRWRFEEALREKLLDSQWWTWNLSQLERRDYSDPEKFLDDLRAGIEAGTVTPFEPRVKVIRK